MIRKVALILALAVCGDARAGDRIQFDPNAARLSAILDSYMAATEECLHGRAQYLLFAGLRSRAQIVKQITAMCSPSLRQIMIEKAGFSAAQADSGIEVMAYRALNTVMAEQGATSR